MAFWTFSANAVLVSWLKDDVKTLMPYEDFPTAAEAMSLVREDDPLAYYKRSQILYMLINLESFYPIDKPGKWDDLERHYKLYFKKHGFRWPLRKDERKLLKKDDFDVYLVVMEAYFPEALKLKPSADGSHKKDEVVWTLAVIVAGLVALIIVVIGIRLFQRQ
jgi:hypothetical protein